MSNKTLSSSSSEEPEEMTQMLELVVVPDWFFTSLEFFLGYEKSASMVYSQGGAESDARGESVGSGKLCWMISENRLDAFQTYAGNKSAGIRLRRFSRLEPRLESRDVHLEQGTYIWSKPVMKGTHPSPRDSHSSTAVGSKLYVFGGTDGTSPLDDLFVLDTATNTWGKPDVFGDVPAPREGHSASLIGDNLFVFGGCGKSSDPSEEEYYNDLHVLNTNTFVWKKISTTGVSPIPRDIHTCSSYKNCCIVMGGENSGNAYLYDIHILDTETMAWREVKTTGAKLMPRAGWLLLLLTLLLTIWLPFFCEKMLREKDPSEPKLSMRKELKRRRQEYRATPFVLDKQRDADKSLVSSHGEFQAHVQPLGEKMFKARVRDVFNYGYTLEASIDGKLFRGLLFSYKPGFAQAVQSYILSYSLMPGRKTSQEETAGRPKGRSGSSEATWRNPHSRGENTSGWSHPEERISAWDVVAGCIGGFGWVADARKVCQLCGVVRVSFWTGHGHFSSSGCHICKKIGEEKAARIIKQLVKTFKEIYLRGVVHQNLKLDNILSKLNMHDKW
ncbi:hypothetical protein SELMODRAFT_431741 [Selaginella moellendorffii]|uniref:DCD domain-containing protein n=1 Tax=Selaginella moellendorffii TaxID=88036 RepID=D8TDM5_SELML|nr:hypothetical protein SELMODRAFT_431741 [Selaginella moellendorffii]